MYAEKAIKHAVLLNVQPLKSLLIMHYVMILDLFDP